MRFCCRVGCAHQERYPRKLVGTAPPCTNSTSPASDADDSAISVYAVARFGSPSQPARGRVHPTAVFLLQREMCSASSFRQSCSVPAALCHVIAASVCSALANTWK